MTTDIIDIDNPEALTEALTVSPLARQDVQNRKAESTVSFRRDDGLVVAEPQTLAHDPYVGVSAVPFDERAQAALAKYQHVEDSWLDIKPNGQVYLSHMKARGILNEAFGFGGWAIVPVGPFRVEESGNKVTLYRTYRLYVAGRFVGEVESAGEYYKSNPEQNYGDAAEAAQSYALNRLSKNFGIASQCWDRAYGEQWKAQYAETYKNPKTDKTEWRKKKLGAGSPLSGGRETTNTQPVTHNPEVNPANDAPAPGPAPRVSSGNPTKRIQVAQRKPTSSDKLEWKAGSTRYAMFIDTKGLTWTFRDGAIDTAVKSGGAPIEIEFIQEKSNGRTKSVVVDAWLAEGGAAD